jgi:hypothetical protein
LRIDESYPRVMSLGASNQWKTADHTLTLSRPPQHCPPVHQLQLELQ